MKDIEIIERSDDKSYLNFQHFDCSAGNMNTGYYEYYEWAEQQQFIDGQTLKKMFSFAVEWLAKSESDVNILNVFPVPDGDTGTNMLLTMRSCIDEASKVEDPKVSSVIKAMANGAFLGARGNSGVILSQIWRGMARSCQGKDKVSGSDLSELFQSAAVTAYEGLENPVEGTILTVIKEVANATLEYRDNENESFLKVLQIAVDAAGKAVANTPNLLPVLKDAGVVDSGGQGLYILLEGALIYLSGQTDKVRSSKSKIINSNRANRGRLTVPDQIQEESKNKGRSLIEINGKNPSAAIAVVAIAMGDGIIDIFHKKGAVAVVSGIKTMNPSTKEILLAVEAVQSDQVIVLPNDKNLVLVAQQVTVLSNKNVRVLPAVTIPQGIAALSAFNPQSDLQTNINMMNESRSLVKTVEVTRATRSTKINGFTIQKGQTIGFLDGKLIAVGDRASDTIFDLLSKIDLIGAKTVSIYYRNGSQKFEAEKIKRLISQKNPELNIFVLQGGQPLYDYLFSIS